MGRSLVSRNGNLHTRCRPDVVEGLRLESAGSEFLATAAPPISLGTWPYIVLAFYLVGLLSLGVISLLRSRRATNAETDYYLAGRGQGVIVTSLTIMATFFSSFAILTFPGWIYEGGIAPMLYALNLPVAAVAIYLLGNRIRRIGRKRGYITPADMVADYYGDSPALRIIVALTGALYVIPYVVIQIKGGGLLADGLLEGGVHREAHLRCASWPRHDVRGAGPPRRAAIQATKPRTHAPTLFLSDSRRALALSGPSHVGSLTFPTPLLTGRRLYARLRDRSPP